MALKKMNFALSGKLSSVQTESRKYQGECKKWMEHTNLLHSAKDQLLKKSAPSDQRHTLLLPDIPPMDPDTNHDYDLPDIPSIRLKITRLTNEKQFFSTENVSLRSKLSDTQSKVFSLDRYMSSLSARYQEMERDWKSSHKQIRLLSVRCVRAEKVAAGIEKQFRELVPNVKIDYGFLPTLEPSTHLLAALTPTVTTTQRFSPFSGRSLFSQCGVGRDSFLFQCT